MDRRILLRYLEQSQRHLARGRQQMAELEAIGYNTAIARQLLLTFKELQELHEAVEIG